MMLNTADAHDFIDQLTLEGVPWHRLTTPYGRGDELLELGRGRGISNLDKKARITRPAPLI